LKDPGWGAIFFSSHYNVEGDSRSLKKRGGEGLFSHKIGGRIFLIRRMTTKRGING